MKTLIISLLLTGSMSSLFAQTDSTSSSNMSQDPTINATTPKTDNSVSTDSMHTMIADSTAINNITNAADNNSNPITPPVTPKHTEAGKVAPATVYGNSTSTDAANPTPATTVNNTTAATASMGVIANAANVQGQQGYASLPVLESFVPDAVVAKAKEKYGSNIYDITGVKHTADETAYMVRYQDNGAYKCEKISADGTVIPQQ